MQKQIPDHITTADPDSGLGLPLRLHVAVEPFDQTQWQTDGNLVQFLCGGNHNTLLWWRGLCLSPGV
jgi:hypothetical protein